MQKAKILNWEPKTNLNKNIKIMLDYEKSNKLVNKKILKSLDC